ncbi:MAG TPA: XkdX family protein [Syntrophomonadaceae bacterium]|nr:XkdX family protein [Syntrophomonadaceae bacterium]
MWYNWWTNAYKLGWATEAMLEQAVTKGQITVDQKAQIIAQ